MPLLFVLIVALALTMVLVPLLARAAGRLRVLDQPSGRKVHTQPVPRVGGIAMIIGTTVPLLLWLRMTPQEEGFLIASAILLVFGVWDDRVQLGWKPKLLGQMLAVAAVLWIGDVRVVSWTLEAREPIVEWISWPLSFFFLLGVTNAINLADGLDGLAGGTTLLCFSALALLAYAGGDILTCTLAVATIGSILGFLRFNTYPARVFMGDSGSQFLGLGVGTLALMATQNPQNPVSAALPVLLLGLPILDTLMVMTQRILEGRSPFHADRNHIHHRLLALGFEHHEAVVAIYLLQCLLFLAAYFLRFESDVFILMLFGVFALAMIVLLQRAQSRGWRWHKDRAGVRRALLTRQIEWLCAQQRLPRWIFVFICLCVPAYSLWVIGRATAVTEDLALLALVLLALGVAVLPWAWSRDPGWLERAVIYVAAVLVVYLDQTRVQTDTAAMLVFFGLLAIAVVMRFRLSGDRRFEVTPLDVLVIFIALVVPNLPGSIQLPPGLPLGIGKIVVLLYAVEMIMAARLRWNVPRAVVGVVLAALALRGLAVIQP